MSGNSLHPGLRRLSTSATLAINERSAALVRAGHRVFRFGLGQSPFPVPTSVVRALQTHAAEKDYLPVAGLPALRQAVADYHARRDGLALTPEGVLIGPGSKELMFLAQLAFDGDLVVPTPCWVSYGPQAQILGRRISRLPTRFESRWRLDPADLDALCRGVSDRKRLLVLNYPDNPTGLTYSAAELEAIAEVARRHGVIVLSDEIYAPLSHTGTHTSIARFYPEGTIVSGGLSKWCGAGGWRLGTFTFPSELEWLRAGMAVAASETFTSVCAPVQYAGITAFAENDELTDYLVHARRVLAALGAHCVTQMVDAGARVHAPDGGFYLMVDFSPCAEALRAADILDGHTMSERLLAEAGVAALPAADFERPETELALRLAYVDFDGSAALDASRAVGCDNPLPNDFLAQYCTSVVDGISALARWLTGLVG